MKPHSTRRTRLVLVTSGALVVLALLWNNAWAERPWRLAFWTKAPGAKATTQELGGAERYLTAVSTDKPIYRAGEKVYVRGVLLNAVNRKPLPENQQTQTTIEIKGPKGDTVASGFAQSQDSAWGFAWEVPAEQAGGEYTVKVTYPWTGHAPAERKLDIRTYRAPRLRNQIVFLRDGYGPGEKVTATLHSERAEGGIPEGAKVTVNARVDGMAVDGGTGKVDAKGNCTVSFDLPREIPRGEGTLALIVEDGGVVETASKTIPILLQTLDIKFYPEGGELVAGLPNRVYFEARQPNGKPADIEGIVEDIESPTQGFLPRAVGNLSTQHEGRGRVEFTPTEKHSYVLRIGKPAGITKRFPLPAVKNDGVVLRATTDKHQIGKPITVDLYCTPGFKHKFALTLAQRENEIDRKNADFDMIAHRDWKSQMEVVLDPKDADGILRVTVWDEKGTPLAERLIYREPAKKLKVEVTADKPNAIPGAPAKLTVKTTGADGKPVSAVVGLTVTDDSVLEMIEKREQAPRLPVMVFLEPEVKELADAHVYLDESNPKAPLALDLLLGTQGWRRFAFMDAAKFIAENGDAARRVLALRKASVQERRRAAFRGGCFLAGTMVLTESGPQAIETVRPGTLVQACDPATGSWTFKPVTRRLRHDYEGDVMTIEAADVRIEATGNHPFWVVRGRDLESRPEVADVPAKDRAYTARGRWVEARDLEAGDLLCGQNRGETTISSISSRQARTVVWNLTVTELHTYAVSTAGLLVHNKEAAIVEEEMDGMAEMAMPMAAAAGEKGAVRPAREAKVANAAPPAAPEPPPAVEGPKPAKDQKPVDKLEQAMAVAGRRMQEKAIMADRQEEAMPRNNLILVREYAHQARPDRKPNDRVDFTETLYWNAGVKTGADGTATVAFSLNDSVTTFRVFADAFGSDGALGAGISALESRQPFYVEAKLPLEVTAGDLVLVPVTAVNGTPSVLSALQFNTTVFGAALKSIEAGELSAEARIRRLVELKIPQKYGLHDFILKGTVGPLYQDQVTRKLSVKPRGFPIESAFGGLLSAPAAVSHSVTIPETVVPNSVTTRIAVYPTPLANMSEALQRLIQDPNGCFEQTSSTSYPLTMAQQYFLSHTGVDGKMVEMARTKLDAGYKRLVSFWCPDRGYEWFGEDPGHEALTAFGLLHFTDMAQVREVDQAMITSTRAWLMKQRDGKGGFERKRRALHTWIEDKDCSNAYIIWALLESGEKPETLSAEVAAVKEIATKSSNSYVIALGALTMQLANDKAAATELMQRLAKKQEKNGEVGGGTASIVGSDGEALGIETTALTTLAWLRDPSFAGNVEHSMKFLADSCKAGRYGSTQSTVLALRAIVAYDKARAHPKAPGRVKVFVDGQGVGDWMNFDQSTQGAIELPDVSELLGKGEHKVEVKMENGSEMPYSVAVTYNAMTPASSKDCKLDISVKLAQAEVAEGAATEANVTVTNRTKEAIPTPVAIVGLPGGLEPRHDQLKELVKKHTIDAYEVIGREVVLYWRGLAAEQKVEIPISVIAAVPGTYTGPASRAYLYYTDEHKQWVDGVQVTIK